MSERSARLLVLDMINCIDKILGYTKEMNFETYSKDIKTRDAVERNFQIIGEASARIAESFKENYAHIEWRIMKDFRNFLVHNYFGVDDGIVWDVVQNRLSDLRAGLSQILQDNQLEDND